MPKDTLKLFAVMSIDKDTQFSKEARLAAYPWAASVNLIPARTLAEVEELVEDWPEADGNFRVVIYELAEPVAMKRLSISSVAERPYKVLNRAGSFA